MKTIKPVSQRSDKHIDILTDGNYCGHNNIKEAWCMDDIQKIMPVTKVKRELLEIIKTMQEEDSTITLTRNGAPVGVMMTPDRYEALFETIEILADKEILALLGDSAKDFKNGRVCEENAVWDD
jgi:antitoxin YefM